MHAGAHSRGVLDLLHLGNPRRPMFTDEMRYCALDQNGQQSNPNPNYLSPIIWQAPFAARVGVEVGF